MDDFNLADLELEEVDTNIIYDTFENRQVLRQNKLSWRPIDYPDRPDDQLIQVFSPEEQAARATKTLTQRSMLLTDTRDVNSDYETQEALLLIDNVEKFVPRWVLGATKEWIRVRRERDRTGLPYHPHWVEEPRRCVAIKKGDGMRCMLWTSGHTANGLCKTHSGSTGGLTPQQQLDRARAKITQSVQAAADNLEFLMHNAKNEQVQLRATESLLDRAGIRGGFEITNEVEVTVLTANDILKERLTRLKKANERRDAIERGEDPDAEIVDAEVVEDDNPSAEEGKD